MCNKIQPILKVAFLTACTAAAVSVAVMCIKVASVANNVNNALDYSNPNTPMGRVNTALNSEQKGTFMCNITHAAGKFNALVGSDNLLNEPKNEPKDGKNKPHGTLESVVNEVSEAAKGLHNGMKQKGGIGIFSGISYAAEEPTEVSAEGKGTATEAKLAQQQESSGWFSWFRRD